MIIRYEGGRALRCAHILAGRIARRIYIIAGKLKIAVFTLFLMLCGKTNFRSWFIRVLSFLRLCYAFKKHTEILMRSSAENNRSEVIPSTLSIVVLFDDRACNIIDLLLVEVKLLFSQFVAGDICWLEQTAKAVHDGAKSFLWIAIPIRLNGRLLLILLD